MASTTWKEALADRIESGWADEIDQFEGQLELRKPGDEPAVHADEDVADPQDLGAGPVRNQLAHDQHARLLGIASAHQGLGLAAQAEAP